MLIDWFTVGAQAINFLILVWLMKRFLYKPILHAIDARENRIAKALADADAKIAEAQKERDEFHHKNEEFDQQRAELVSQAKEEARTERQRLLDEARQAADAVRDQRRNAMRLEQQSLNDDIARRTREEVFAVVRKTLADLAGASLEERMSEVFTRRLDQLQGDAKEGLAKALKTSSAPAVVRSAFELPQKQRDAIQHALNESFSAEIQIHFETAPGVIGGIELTANGQKLAWSITEYLGSLEKRVSERLEEQSTPRTRTAANAELKAKSETEPAAPKETT